jgi:hypothetical protein
MGHNDHINWDLHEAIERLIDEGLLEEGSDLHKLAELAADEGFLTPAEAALYQRDIEPLLVKLGDYHERDYQQYLADKDD